MAARYDLHVHSTASDGMLAPREVVALAANRGLAGIALTDHDTMDGIAEARGMAEALGLRLIAGVELSCTGLEGRLVHLLGYLCDPDAPGLVELFASMRARRVERAAAIVTRVAELTGGGLEWSDVEAEAGAAPPGRPHIARAMRRRGLLRDVDEAFSDEWFGTGGRAWVDRAGVPVGEAIAQVHAAGGVAVYAHPGARTADGLPEAAIRDAARLGLDGIEVDHPGHGPAEVEACARLAGELGLLQTAGSDDHGPDAEASRMGCRTVPARVVEQMRERAATHGAGTGQ